MRPTHCNEPPAQPDTEAERDAAFARKQKWKEQPGNRYTPDELREMSDSLGSLRITQQETPVMNLE